MKKTIAILNLAFAVAVAASVTSAETPQASARHVPLGSIVEAAATPAGGGQEQKKQPQWKSTDEYNAFQAMSKETDPNKKLSLADAFLQKFSNSDFKYLAHLQMMQAYQQLGQADKAVGEAREVLKDDVANIQALQYLAFALPFLYKPADANAATELSNIESTAKTGLDALAKVQKPPNVTEEQFNTAIKPVRAVFNAALGFAALQKKDYAAAITSFKAAMDDNPNDMYTTYRLGVAYLSSATPDYSNAFWYLARAVSLGKTNKAPDEAGIEKYLTDAYANYHGNDDGLQALIAQAGAAPNPPAGFAVAPLQKPKPTGNPQIDSFNEVTFQLKLGGPLAQKAWDQLKGQPLGLGGFVHDVQKGSDPGTYLVHITLDQAKVASGYDIELKDSTQPAAAELSQGDPVHFQGTIASYTNTPTFVLTLEKGTINDDDLEAAKAKTKTKAKPTRRRPGRGR